MISYLAVVDGNIDAELEQLIHLLDPGLHEVPSHSVKDIARLLSPPAMQAAASEDWMDCCHLTSTFRTQQKRNVASLIENLRLMAYVREILGDDAELLLDDRVHEAVEAALPR